MGILLSALTPYNNDLHLTNLVNIPALAVHGSIDGNVPPRHGRSYAAILSSLAGHVGSVNVAEVDGENHWWDDVFREPVVKTFIRQHLKKATWDEDRSRGFTLTCGNPSECGSRAGIRIVEVITPGR
jgi:hypothetical protein